MNETSVAIKPVCKQKDILILWNAVEHSPGDIEFPFFLGQARKCPGHRQRLMGADFQKR